MRHLQEIASLYHLLAWGNGYKRENCMDTMTVCKWYGFPDLFITFTCNPNWPEVQRFLSERKRRLEARPDIIDRVFQIKLKELMTDIRDRNMFDRTKSGNLD